MWGPSLPMIPPGIRSWPFAGACGLSWPGCGVGIRIGCSGHCNVSCGQTPQSPSLCPPLRDRRGTPTERRSCVFLVLPNCLGSARCPRIIPGAKHKVAGGLFDCWASQTAATHRAVSHAGRPGARVESKVLTSALDIPRQSTYSRHSRLNSVLNVPHHVQQLRHSTLFLGRLSDTLTP